jgi:branched-subunit amino acid aminotransferase/4-amino-4-deoxychorismate lyase
MRKKSYGVFESMRCFKGRIVFFDEHIKRLKCSCGKISIQFPYGPEEIRKEIAESVKVSGLKDAYVRLALFRLGEKTEESLIVKKYTPFTSKKYNQGFSADIAKRIQDYPRLARIKSTDRQTYESAFMQAKKAGFDEALIFNRKGYACEATRSNIFLVKGSQLVTPLLECGCLDGITRKAICCIAAENNIKVSQGSFSAQEILNADEAFLTNSLMGVMPLVSVGKRLIGKGKPGKLTKFFISRYRSLLKHENKKDKITF